MGESHVTQKQLSERWALSERTLEYWRSKGLGPTFLKLGGLVRYRIEDIEAYEQNYRREGTFGNQHYNHGGVL